MNFRWLILFAIFPTPVLCANSPFYSDGGEHTFDGTEPSVFVDGTRQVTRVTMKEPGEISHLDVWDGNEFIQEGGHISHVQIKDQSRFTISGGDFSHLTLADQSYGVLAGGTGDHVSAIHDGVVDIVGGVFGFASAAPDFNSPTQTTNGTVNLYGGDVGVAKLYDGGTLNVYGGTLHGINPLGAGTSNVYGGVIQNFTLNDQSITNIFVRSYEQEPIEPVHGTPHFMLRAVLENGDYINAEVGLHEGAVLNFISVPEPDCVWPMAIALSCCVARRRKRRLASCLHL